jgi:hypothetical protein
MRPISNRSVGIGVALIGRLTSVLLALAATVVLATVPRAAAAAELVMFESAGCEWCERWNEEVGVIYARTEEGKTLPLRRVDVDETLPDDLKAYDGVYFTPTFVVLDGEREVGRIVGYPGEDFFWGLLHEVLARLSSSPETAGR